MADIIQLRRDSAANWTSEDPVLAAGEIALDTTNMTMRVGDGTSNWSDLDDWNPGPDGDSAYQVWLDEGNSGTEQDFLDALVGETGPQGETGETGATGAAGTDGVDGSSYPGTSTEVGTHSSGACDLSTGAIFDIAPTALLNSAHWTASGSGTGEYYYTGTPPASEPDAVLAGGTALAAGTVGSLAAGEWDWGDNDSIGANTVYVRLSDDADPDSEDEGHITYMDDLTISVTNAPSGKDSVFMLRIVSGGDVTITWPNGITWPAGAAPTLTEGGTDRVGLMRTDAGAFSGQYTLDIKAAS